MNPKKLLNFSNYYYIILYYIVIFLIIFTIFKFFYIKYIIKFFSDILLHIDIGNMFY